MQYLTKGAANLCGVVEIVNEEFDEAILQEVEDRLMPRTEELPLYTTHEFNDKVMAGAGAIDVKFSLLTVQLQVYFFFLDLDPDLSQYADIHVFYCMYLHASSTKQWCSWMCMKCYASLWP